MIRFLLIGILLVQLCYSISFMNRLIVPIYYSTSITYGYDSNNLKFSDKEKLDSTAQPWLLGDNELQSSIIKGGAILTYLPYFFEDHETQLKVKLNYSNFVDANDKNYYSYSFKLAQHLGAYSWLRFSYSLLPELYLREYVDRDNPIQLPFIYPSAFFSIENLQIQYSAPIPSDKSYLTLSYGVRKQYYNEEFTEFDLEIKDYKVGIYIRDNPHSKISTSLTISIAENIAFQDGYISTISKDRGYRQDKFWLSVSMDEQYCQFFSERGMSISIEKRYFLSSLISDPLHMGREHDDNKLSLWVKKKISKKIDAKIAGSYRSRITRSTQEFVKGLKSFHKFDFFITFTYNSNFNIYY
ncbi:MAG: hypothetical protein H8E72_00175 [Candidatus Marinimicrobia bacterium]|nr:hypothetical protein [Candidatus Neomarinimicrobiota bacterium]